MTNSEFEALVLALEARAAKSPKSFRAECRLFSHIGVAYFGLLFALSFLLAMAGLIILLVLVLSKNPNLLVINLSSLLFLTGSGLLFLMIRALCQTDHEEERFLQVSPSEFPLLFEEIRRLEAQLSVRPIEAVFMNIECNAAVSQRPAIGPFGLASTHLHLGLPLMQALDLAEFRAVLAHELAHHSSQHGSFFRRFCRSWFLWANFIRVYRASQSDRMRSGTFLVSGFLNWYAPRFEARACVIRRVHEYEADRLAATLAGRDALVRALVRLEVTEHRSERDFWERLPKEAGSRKDAPRDVYVRLAAFYKSLTPDAKMVRVVDVLSKRSTDYTDSHPSLAARAAALDYGLEWRGGDLSPLAWRMNELLNGAADRHPLDVLVPRPIGRSSADHLLGERGERLTTFFSRRWYEELKDDWKSEHESLKKEKERLEEVGARGGRRMADGQTLLEKALLVEAMEDESKALELYRQAVARDRKNHYARAHLGRLLLDAENDEGIGHLLEAARGEIRLARYALYLVAEFLEGKARDKELEPFIPLAQNYEDLCALADMERSNFSDTDNFVAPIVQDETLRIILRSILVEPNVQRVFLIEKSLDHFQEERLFIVIVDVKPQGLFGTRSEADRIADRIAERMSIEEAQCLIVIPWDRNKGWKELALCIPGSELFWQHTSASSVAPLPATSGSRDSRIRK